MKNINSELESYIFEELGATYKIDPKGVSFNLNNDLDKTKDYLGTYFPRSFVEAYQIYNNIFSDKNIYNVYNKKEELNILDIGSGTGGNLLGLLNVLVSTFKNKQIKVYSIDGNSVALDFQKNLIKNANTFLKLNGNSIKVKLHNITFNNKDDFNTKLKKLNFNGKLDIIQTFKFINEFYNIDYPLNKGMYSDLLKSSNEWLNKNGMLLALDVTNMVGNQDYNSIIMNNECKEYFKNSETELYYILPICCALWNSRCNWNKCFSQITFSVNHRYSDNCKTKVNFKLFFKSPLGKLVFGELSKNTCYKLSDNVYCTVDNYHYNCSDPHTKAFDPFSL